MYSVIMPTVCNAPQKLQDSVFKTIDKTVDPKAQRIVCSSLHGYMIFQGWESIQVDRQSNPYRDCYCRLLAMLDHCKNDTVYVVEHDVLYPVGYFSAPPVTDKFLYNTHLHTLTERGFIQHYDRIVTSQLVAPKHLLIEHYKRAVQWIDCHCRVMWDEPGLNWNDDGIAFPKVADIATWQCERPAVDVRWGGNLTGDRLAKQYALRSSTWGDARELRKEIGV